MSIGGIIKTLRNNHGLSRRELAELAGITQSQVAVIEKGARIKNDNILTSIAEVLETDLPTLHSMSEMSQISKIHPNSTEND